MPGDGKQKVDNKKFRVRMTSSLTLFMNSLSVSMMWIS